MLRKIQGVKNLLGKCVWNQAHLGHNEFSLSFHYKRKLMYWSQCKGSVGNRTSHLSDNHISFKCCNQNWNEESTLFLWVELVLLYEAVNSMNELPCMISSINHTTYQLQTTTTSTTLTPCMTAEIHFLVKANEKNISTNATMYQ